MSTRTACCNLAAALLTGLAVAVVSLAAPIVAGHLAPAAAQPAAQEWVLALEPHGRFVKHPRFGQVWILGRRPHDWRPYEYGRWVYTDEWGWYWVSDPDEEDWGWVTYHYGRWAFDRRIGWFWVPGHEWAPAWVDWRYGDGYVGWAALPPDDLLADYEAEPALWLLAPLRYLTSPRLRTYVVPQRQRLRVFRATRIVNRTLPVQGAQLGVNAGLAPGFVAAAMRTAVPAYRVQPRVFVATQGVAGAVPVRQEDLRKDLRKGAARRRGGAPAITLQRTNTPILPAAGAPAPKPLGKDERGSLGPRPPRAAQAAPAPAQPPAASPARKPQPLRVAPPQPQAPAPQRVAPPTPPAPPQVQKPQVVPRDVQSPPPPREERNQRPPMTRQGEPPPQAKPQRPIAPQAPPPPPPRQSPAARPSPPPPPPLRRPPAPKPDEKPDEKKKPAPS